MPVTQMRKEIAGRKHVVEGDCASPGVLWFVSRTVICMTTPARSVHVPLEEMLSTRQCADALQELVDEGHVKYIGLSEVSPADIRRAHAIHPITALEMEWSLFSRDAEVSKSL